MQQTKPTIRVTVQPATALVRVAICLCALVLIVGCKVGPKQGDEPIQLPSLGDQFGPKPGSVYALVRRADVALSEPTDAAWSLINESIVPPLTRGAWRGNGLRLGMLRRDQLADYELAMPPLIAFGRTVVSESNTPVPIIETGRLRGDLLFEIDLTRPPKPLKVEDIAGGKGSTLRLLARIEIAEDGQRTLILTPHHYIPSPLNLTPRDPLKRDLDGRIFDELSVRLTLDEEQIAVVGLYWPWPEEDNAPANTQTPTPTVVPEPIETEPALPPADADDPAAPPAHITRPGIGQKTKPDDKGDRVKADPTPPQRLAPPLPVSFGSTLFTGTRIRKPARAVLLITIERVPDAPVQPGSEKEPGSTD